MHNTPFSIESKIEILERNTPIAMDCLEECTVCPRECLANRIAGDTGECGVPAKLMISSANLHYGEEPPISGTNGSGTIFLSGCNLHCVYCQNYPISQYRNGEYYSSKQAAAKMVALEKRGAHNINLVTPSHYVPLLMEALLIAYKSGLTVPIVYNSSGYDSIKMLELLAGVVDIYMPDMRYADSKYSKIYSAVDDYPQVNRASIREMHRQVGILDVVNGIAARGLLIRHLVMPGGVSGSAEIFSFVADEISQDTYMAVMSQYFPAYNAGNYPELSKRLKLAEYKDTLHKFEDAGLANGYIQPFTG